MRIIDRGPEWPSNERFVLGRVVEVDNDRVVHVQRGVGDIYWFHLESVNCNGDADIINDFRPYPGQTESK